MTRSRSLLHTASTAALCVLFATVPTPRSSAATKPTAVSPEATTTTLAPTPKVVLGGGRLTREYSPNMEMIDDNYVVVVASPIERLASVYVESTFKCTGSNTSFRGYFEHRDLKIRTGSFPVILSPTAPGFQGSLRLSLRFTSTDLTRVEARVLSGSLRRASPALTCKASPVPLDLRLAHGDAAAPNPSGPVAGAAYFGGVADSSQRTAFLLNVSADGKEVTNRELELFLDCAAKKPYEFLDLNDWARFPITPAGTFEFRESWKTRADKIGLDPKHRLEISTFTSGAFAGGRVAGKVRLDAKVVDIATGTVLDSCTSKDRSFEAST